MKRESPENEIAAKDAEKKRSEMISKIAKHRSLHTIFLILLISLVLSFLFTTIVQGIPTGPTVSLLGNSTAAVGSAAKVNSTNGSLSPGGFIFTTLIDSRQQNSRWKAYVGNVTGTLALDDASGNTIFQWSLTATSGEVYATRSSATINWSGINCTWHGESGISRYVDSNRTIEEIENFVMNHSNKEDNITATFSRANHSQLVIGAITIAKNACFAVQTFQKCSSGSTGCAQVFSDSDNANFTQVILYDGTNNSVDKSAKSFTGNLVYTTKIQNDIQGFVPGSVFDFQMILPENGAPGYASSTAYYFYVELS